MNAQTPEPPALAESERAEFCYSDGRPVMLREQAIPDVAARLLAARDAAWAERLKAVEQERGDWKVRYYQHDRTIEIGRQQLADANADVARVLALVEQLDADLAASAPAHTFSVGLVRGWLKTIREAVSGR